jgi:hypothetical protein
MARDAKGEPCDPLSEIAVSFCLMGAADHFGGRHINTEVYNAIAAVLPPEFIRLGYYRIADFNNNSSYKDIMILLDKAIELEAKKLA